MLTVLAAKDGVGFACFFSAHEVLQRRLRAEPERRRRAGVHDSEWAQARAVGSAAIAGAGAGSAFHAVSHPIDRAISLADVHLQTRATAELGPVVCLQAVAREAAAQGPRVLYRGVGGSAGGGICIGALTFACYEMTLLQCVNEGAV